MVDILLLRSIRAECIKAGHVPEVVDTALIRAIVRDEALKNGFEQ